MSVSIKVGSRLVLPVLQGWIATSSMPAVCQVGIQGSLLIVQALSAGQATLTLRLGAVSLVSVAVSVTTA